MSTLTSSLGLGPVSFEVDHIDEALVDGWRVSISGWGHVIVDAAEHKLVQALGVPQWALVSGTYTSASFRMQCQAVAIGGGEGRPGRISGEPGHRGLKKSESDSAAREQRRSVGRAQDDCCPGPKADGRSAGGVRADRETVEVWKFASSGQTIRARELL